MTLFAWVAYLEYLLKELEDIAKELRTTAVRINYLHISQMKTILDEHYVRWLFWVDAYYGRSTWDHLSLDLDSVSPSYALLIPFIWFGKVWLNYKTRYTEGYLEVVESKRGTSPWYGKLQLNDLAGGYVPRLEVELELRDNRYLHIEEGGFTFPRYMVLPRLLPTLTL